LICEGKERQQQKQHHATYGEGTAVTLRLCQKYLGTHRIIHADSAFASVKTLEALKDRGLDFMGIVKTATKRYPSKILKAWATGKIPGIIPARGEHVILESTLPNGSQMYALCWNDKKAKI
jgi:hypothetical protein